MQSFTLFSIPKSRFVYLEVFPPWIQLIMCGSVPQRQNQAWDVCQKLCKDSKQRFVLYGTLLQGQW